MKSVNPWRVALKQYNTKYNKGQRFCIPKKTSPEYNEVMSMVAKLKRGKKNSETLIARNKRLRPQRRTSQY